MECPLDLLSLNNFLRARKLIFLTGINWASEWSMYVLL